MSSWSFADNELPFERGLRRTFTVLLGRTVVMAVVGLTAGAVASGIAFLVHSGGHGVVALALSVTSCAAALSFLSLVRMTLVTRWLWRAEFDDDLSIVRTVRIIIESRERAELATLHGLHGCPRSDRSDDVAG